jgi:hypothetical protein
MTLPVTLPFVMAISQKTNYRVTVTFAAPSR